MQQTKQRYYSVAEITCRLLQGPLKNNTRAFSLDLKVQEVPFFFSFFFFFTDSYIWQTKLHILFHTQKLSSLSTSLG